MQKQIRYDLFGLESSEAQPAIKSSLPSDLTWEEVLKTDQKISELRQMIQAVKDSLEAYKKDQALQWHSLKNQIDQLTQSMKILEQNDHQLAESLRQQRQTQHQKSVELQNTEQKVQELIQKHHMVLKSYDLKIHTLQAQLQKSENLLMSYQSQLIEAKAEIARLKKA
ncbi:MAG: hypothetical protein N2Z70_03145 [Bdellovibrionaceae bacterium]|jgi:chromosome segregation ATPase|nr:hypothetical protein [Pseudobdellovibrionaceae bacterium]